jgi:AraC-like DNA-binding protein
MTAIGNPVRLDHHEGEGTGWELARGQLDLRLRPHVIGYTGYREFRGPVVRRREVATTVVPVIINFGPAFRLLDRDDENAAGRLRGSFVAGLHDTWTLVESTGWSHCLQIDFTATGAGQFLGLPIAEMVGQVVDLEAVLGREIAFLAEQLQDLSDWAKRFRMVDCYLARRMVRTPDAKSLPAYVLARLGGQGGDIAIGAIADDLGMSHKHLISRFRAAFGMTPKTVARLFRFEKAVGLIESGASGFADVAVECGYFDQAHFHRDFREFAGCTPAVFRERSIPEGGVIEPPTVG